MEAIVLAGGFGTRLKHVISDVPKPMAPVDKEPFLKYILEYLMLNGITRVIIATGYKAEIIQNYFGNDFKGMEIVYSHESIPLGTGGAIKQALEKCKEKDVVVCNGDTLYKVDVRDMMSFHYEMHSALTLAVKPMQHFERYGAVVVKNGIVQSFEEKKKVDAGLINGGVYIIDRYLLADIGSKVFSFEKAILEDKSITVYAYESSGYFIDIGVPEDYYKAQKEINN